MLLVRDAIAIRIPAIADIRASLGAPGRTGVDGYIILTQAQSVGGTDSQPTGRGLDRMVFIGAAIAIRVGAIAEIVAGTGSTGFAAIQFDPVDAVDASIGRTLAKPARGEPRPKTLVCTAVTVGVDPVAGIGAGGRRRCITIIAHATLDTGQLPRADTGAYAATGLHDHVGFVGSAVTIRVDAITPISSCLGTSGAATIGENAISTQAPTHRTALPLSALSLFRTVVFIEPTVTIAIDAIT